MPEINESKNAVLEDARDEKSLNISHAFIKAWDEFNVRITARHTLIISYINISAAILGAIFLSDNGQNKVELFKNYVYYAMPVATLIFSALLVVHDISMNNLIRYLVFLETINKHFPSYHAWNKRAGWGYQKYSYRFWQSLCIISIMLVLNSVAFYVGWENGHMNGLGGKLFWLPVLIGVSFKITAILGRRSGSFIKGYKPVSVEQLRRNLKLPEIEG